MAHRRLDHEAQPEQDDRPGETEEEYLAKVMSNKDAIIVKLADLRHNSDIRRLKGVTEKDVRRIEKYHRMYLTLRDLT